MSLALPENAHLDHLKGQAKALLKALEANDSEALSRARTLGFSPPFRLATAQSILAKEYGFASWAKLKREVEVDRPVFERLLSAVRGGDREEVSRLSIAHPHLLGRRSERDFDAPLLNIAAARNDLKMVALLADLGVDLDARSTWWAGGFNALDSGNEETCRFLLERGATLTPHAAAKLGMADALRAMIARVPDVVHRRGGDGQFPLHFAKTPEIVDLLVDAGADLEGRDLDHEGTALQFRVLDPPIRRRLLERGARPDIFTAVVEDDPDLVAQILEDDPEAVRRKPTDPGNPQIPQAPGAHIYVYVLGSLMPHQVAFNRGKRRAYAAIAERADPPHRLAMAAWAKDRTAAEALAKEHPGLAGRLSAADARVLPDAAWERRLSAVRLMLELGWDVNARGDHASSAIDRAAFHGFADVIEAILPYGPDLTQTNDFGGTPLGACLYGSLHGWRRDGDYARSIALLIEAGAPRPERAGGSELARETLKRYGIE